MAIELLTVSALVCEKFLIEQDGVFSAIRIVDIFYVEDARPNVSITFSVLVVIRAKSSATASLRLIHKAPSGLEKVLGSDLPESLNLVPKFPADNIPVGKNLGITINLQNVQLGTHYILIEIDGAIAASVPFTLRPSHSATS